jgi:hypothetical protein
VSDDGVEVSRVIAVEEHAWTAELRAALLKFGGDDTVTAFSNDDTTNHRLLGVGEERLARMDSSAPGADLGLRLVLHLKIDDGNRCAFDAVACELAGVAAP